MSLKSAIKRIERDLKPEKEVFLYCLSGIESEDEPKGMVKVFSWNKPDWKEFINYEEYDQRIANAKARGEQIAGFPLGVINKGYSLSTVIHIRLA